MKLKNNILIFYPLRKMKKIHNFNNYYELLQALVSLNMEYAIGLPMQTQNIILSRICI